MKEETELELRDNTHESLVATSTITGGSQASPNPDRFVLNSKTGQAYIQKHPLASLVIALSLGVVLGRMFR